MQLRIFPRRTDNHDPRDQNDCALIRDGRAISVLVDPEADSSIYSRDWLSDVFSTFPWTLGTDISDFFGVMTVAVDFELRHKGISVPIHAAAQVDTFDHPWESLGRVLSPGIDLKLGQDAIGFGMLALRQKLLMNGTMTVRPVFAGRHFFVDRSLCFVAMPFTQPWSQPVFDTCIRSAIQDCGLKCVRADNYPPPGVIIEDIWTGINTVLVVVADTTGANANVYYELGIAHVVGVPTIIVTQDATPAFDVTHLRHIIYENSAPGRERLASELRTALTALLESLRFP